MYPTVPKPLCANFCSSKFSLWHLKMEKWLKDLSGNTVFENKRKSHSLKFNYTSYIYLDLSETAFGAGEEKASSGSFPHLILVDIHVRSFHGDPCKPWSCIFHLRAVYWPKFTSLVDHKNYYWCVTPIPYLLLKLEQITSYFHFLNFLLFNYIFSIILILLKNCVCLWGRYLTHFGFCPILFLNDFSFP